MPANSAVQPYAGPASFPQGSSQVATLSAPVTRNSANDATDANFQTLAVITIPANTLRVGSLFIVSCIFEFTNSANGKIVSPIFTGITTATLTASAGQLNCGYFEPIFVTAPSQMYLINSLGPSGAVAAALLSLSLDITQPINIGFQGRWSAGSIAGEFIRITAASVLHFPPA